MVETRWVSERNLRIYRRAIAGEQQKRLAQEYGITAPRVGQILRKVAHQLGEPEPIFFNCPRGRPNIAWLEK